MNEKKKTKKSNQPTNAGHKLGGGFKYFLIFTPGEDEPILTSIFFKGVGSTQQKLVIKSMKVIIQICRRKLNFWEVPILRIFQVEVGEGSRNFPYCFPLGKEVS